ncbi:hypothetical protein MtrunA17_Chr4g0013571 [Medicago truncatula]|uniref:Cytoplasmic membrane protein n=1 Tax=Medicago truncatula TaxID=3880 RepID=G7JJL8_MEDTR|nr:uncharacterized protein LOC11432289 [Medicago truncatula]AES87564.1 cytoplasmic membrane protein [Medicago truncatula]RHN59464.1 hypothetical protein MtrunA17_Chr4g0013571 [Medicago truncatula]
MGFSNWFRQNFTDPFLLVLRGGAEPKQLSFSAALGITLGVFPICGVTVFLCGIAIAMLESRINAPIILLANGIATPIELSLIVPFLRFGEFISGSPHFSLTSDALKKVITGQASTELLLSIANALLGWLAASPFILASLYLTLIPCFKLLVNKLNSPPSSPKMPLQPRPEVGLRVRDI